MKTTYRYLRNHRMDKNVLHLQILFFSIKAVSHVVSPDANTDIEQFTFLS